MSNGRGLDLVLFPTELFRQLTVSKTPTASQVEGAIGANVDLRLARPFDEKGFHIYYAAKEISRRPRRNGFAYAMFPSVIGVTIDRIGVKKALALALILWSLAAAAHGLVATVLGFAIMRFILDDTRQMLVHRRARRLRIAAFQRAHDLRVFFDRRLEAARTALVVQPVTLRRARAHSTTFARRR